MGFAARLKAWLDAPHVQTTPPAYTYKAASYADFSAYETGLATETAAGWEPVTTTNRAGGVSETIIATYRKLA